MGWTAHDIPDQAGRIDLDDLDFDRRRYVPSLAYAQSKLANLLFTAELARRLASAGAHVTAAAAHPGWTQTNLQKNSSLFRALNPFFGMRPPEGALPTLYAATAPDVRPNDYFGPTGLFEMRGPPGPASRSRSSRDPDLARRLWEVSEERTGVRFPFERASSAASGS